MQQRASWTRSLLIVGNILLVLVVFAIFWNALSSPSEIKGRYPADDPRSMGGLRGDTVIVVQYFVAERRVNKISIFDDRIAAHGLYDEYSSYVRATLPDALWNDVQTLRTNWCAQAPSFPNPAPDAPFYGVVIRCGDGYGNEVFTIVPEVDLPRPFAKVQAFLPLTDAP